MPADESLRSLAPVKFGPEPSSVGEARQRLAEFLRDVPDDIRTLATLLVSELVTNAVRHASTPFSLRADMTAVVIRVEVADGTAEPPVVRHPSAAEATGRGMWIVNELAEEWGYEPVPDGKLVWFELALVQPEAPEGASRGRARTDDP
jgi:anti-sigma regulatory factor (Ser/Thr protein kinase)